MNVPEAVGVPEMVITFPDQAAETPAGKPFAPATPLLAIPVAPVVAIVMFVKGLLIHLVWLFPAPAAAVLRALIVTATL